LKIRYYLLMIAMLLISFTHFLSAQSSTNADMIITIESAVDQAFKDISSTARIAVIHIQASSNEMSNFITNEMIHMLVTRGYNIVDRVDIDRIRQEQQLQYSGEVDDNTAVNLGRFIGADLVVTGSVSSIGSLQRLLVKVIATETTIIRGSAAVTLSDAQQTQPSTGRGTVSRITINPSTISVNRGESQQFRAVITGSGSYSQNATWSVMGAVSSSTRISTAGLLSVAANESAPTLVIIATSVTDPSKSETATVTVTNDIARATNINIQPATVTVAKGNTQQFTATVTGGNNPAQTVTWTLSGNASSGTGISSNGLLVVAINETASSLTVRATSTVDRSKTGTATVNLTTMVSSVVVTPSATTVHKGETRQFRAVVSGGGNPSQEVTWRVTGGSAGTYIDSNGLLTVSPSESASTLTVTATSRADNTKSGEATVTNPPTTVTSVVVSPRTKSIRKGQTLTFKAVVNGNNHPSQEVTWTVTGGRSGTAISSRGVLTVASGESATNLTVRATSVADASKSGTATVTPTQPAGLAFVVLAGGGSTQLSGDEPHSFDSVLGVNVGVALDISGNPSPMVWEIGARYLTKGAKYEKSFTGVTATQQEFFDFLDIFAKAKLDIPVGANNALQPFAGYAASMLASAKESFEFDGYKTELDIAEHCNTLSHSLLLGADLVFSDRFLVGVEYDYGLTDIFKQNKYTLNTMSMHIGVKF